MNYPLVFSDLSFCVVTYLLLKVTVPRVWSLGVFSVRWIATHTPRYPDCPMMDNIMLFTRNLLVGALAMVYLPLMMLMVVALVLFSYSMIT